MIGVGATSIVVVVGIHHTIIIISIGGVGISRCATSRMVGFGQ